MMQKIILYFLFATLLNIFVYAEMMVISIPFVSENQLQEYVEKGYEIVKVLRHKNEILLIVNEEEMANFAEKYSLLNIVETEKDMRENLSSQSRDLPGYHSYE